MGFALADVGPCRQRELAESTRLGTGQVRTLVDFGWWGGSALWLILCRGNVRFEFGLGNYPQDFTVLQSHTAARCNLHDLPLGKEAVALVEFERSLILSREKEGNHPLGVRTIE